MPRAFRYLFSLLILALLIVGPIAYASYRSAQFRNFRIVRDGILYRSGQMSLSGLKQILRDYEIRTVVSLRDAAHKGDPPPDLAEEEYCKKEEINYVRISPAEWWASDGSVPAEKGVSRFRDLMRDPANYPVLVHCFAGIHRTGAFCAVYRMEFEHWSNAEAINEMKAYGYRNIDDEWDLLGYLEKYQPTWKKTNEINAPERSVSYYHPTLKEPKARKHRKRTASKKW
jgi:protein tyrosine/serine phosphatase